MAAAKTSKSRVLRAETLGLLLIALVILIMVLVRWGDHLAWRAR